MDKACFRFTDEEQYYTDVLEASIPRQTDGLLLASPRNWLSIDLGPTSSTRRKLRE